MHKYSHKNQLHNNTLLKYYTYLVKQRKVKLTHTETHQFLHAHSCLHARMHIRKDCMCVN